MRIVDLFDGKKNRLSFEVFPPKRGMPLEESKEIIKEMAALNPDFISVTYGALGNNSDNNVLVAKEVSDNGILPLAHMTCINSTKDKVEKELEILKANGIKNILALRGDRPKDGSEVKSDFTYASDLIEFIKKKGDFCVGGACYPEGHPESLGVEKDIDNLKKKVDAGCDFFVTQMFFDNNILYNFMYRLLRAKIDIPVLAGIMPVTNNRQIKGIIEISRTMLPAKFKAIVEKFGDNEKAMTQAGIVYALGQIIDLIANGFNYIHLYTLNKSSIAKAITEVLSDII